MNDFLNDRHVLTWVNLNAVLDPFDGLEDLIAFARLRGVVEGLPIPNDQNATFCKLLNETLPHFVQGLLPNFIIRKKDYENAETFVAWQILNTLKPFYMADQGDNPLDRRPEHNPLKLERGALRPGLQIHALRDSVAQFLLHVVAAHILLQPWIIVSLLLQQLPKHMLLHLLVLTFDFQRNVHAVYLYLLLLLLMLLGILRLSLVCPVVLTNDAEPEVIPQVQVIERVLC